MKKQTCLKTFILFFSVISLANGQTNLIINIDGRKTTSLNGEWQIIVDPYENGYYNFRYEARTDGYFKNYQPTSKSELVEYAFHDSQTLHVPGDWNSQNKMLFYYEGTIWYKKSFDYHLKEGRRLFVYFGATNYHAIVYLNGKKLGEHVGGFTPFCFEITNLVEEQDNFLILKVDNKRHREGVPTLNTDWWNYGGITRRVNLIETPSTFIRDYKIQLKKNSTNEIAGWVLLDGSSKEQKVSLTIEKAGVSQKITTNSEGYGEFAFSATIELWSPQNPLLYDVEITAQTDHLKHRIGFRSITTKGDQILLNNNPLFLRGISIHEEALDREGRANSIEDAKKLLNQAKELGCNFVRLAHYPHNEYMLKEADRIGLMVWAEIPVYWTILWENQNTYENAQNQLCEMITRDKNRASVIIWSVANETPRGEARMKFLTRLISRAREMDNTRLISAATEITHKEGYNVIDDPLIEYLDVIGVNEYHGWYGGKPEDTPNMKWKSIYNKPLIITEFGGGAKYGHHGSREERWTEEYQEYLYQQQLKMLAQIPYLRGMSPWILKDFRSPRRPLPVIQDFWNRKGLLSEKGERKKAFFILQNFYNNIRLKE